MSLTSECSHYYFDSLCYTSRLTYSGKYFIPYDKLLSKSFDILSHNTFNFVSVLRFRFFLVFIYFIYFIYLFHFILKTLQVFILFPFYLYMLLFFNLNSL